MHVHSVLGDVSGTVVLVVLVVVVIIAVVVVAATQRAFKAAMMAATTARRMARAVATAVPSDLDDRRGHDSVFSAVPIRPRGGAWSRRPEYGLPRDGAIFPT